MALDAKIPAGEPDQKWDNYKDHVKLVSPANKRKLEVIVIGTGLAGASAAASLGELGYKVKAFCFQDSPCAFHCSTGRHQCGKKLSKRW
jgi:succinate dehydrogenase / fumarate reductase flavoprotein subunit